MRRITFSETPRYKEIMRFWLKTSKINYEDNISRQLSQNERKANEEEKDKNTNMQKTNKF